MGTRANVGFRYKEKDFLFYHHNDGGPSWLGMAVLTVCRAYEPSFMRSRVDKIKLINESRKPTENQIRHWATAHEWDGEKLKAMLTRQALAIAKERPTWNDIANDTVTLEHFLDGLNLWPDYADFIYCSSCEWAYIINLDTDKLEVYTSHYNKDGSKSSRSPKAKITGRYAAAYFDENRGRTERGATLLDEIPLKDIREIPESALRSLTARIDRQH